MTADERAAAPGLHATLSEFAARIDAGAAPVDASRFELGAVVAESFSSIDALARQKGLEPRLEPGALAGLVVETDRAKLKQILGNLLSNAVRYTERGQVRLSGGRTEDQVVIAVEDTGLGIDPRDHQRIFDEFARLDRPHRLGRSIRSRRFNRSGPSTDPRRACP